MAGLLLASCADKDVIGEGGGQQGEVLPEGYMALNINLPTTPTTRAANDEFDDGTENEYKVTDCALLLFEGETEAKATLFSAQEVKLNVEDEDYVEGSTEKDKDNITTSYLATAMVKGRKTTGGKLYALALLNYTNVIQSISSTTNLPTFNIIDSDGNITPKEVDKTTTLADIRELITNVDFTKKKDSEETVKNYFFMTNAILSTEQGGDVTEAPTKGAVFQLAELDPTKVFDTEAKAKADPAGEILVERAVAKATLKVTLNSTSEIKGGDIATIEWTIDNMEPSSFIARNPGELEYIGYINAAVNNYRFVGKETTKGTTSVGSDADYYRTYWCIDPQYKSDATPDNLTPSLMSYTSNRAEYDFTQAYPNNTDKAFYCYENTFNVANQNYKNTTRAILKVTLKDDTSFYTINGGTVKYVQEDVEKNIVGYIISMTEVQSAFKGQLNEDKDYTIDENSITAEYKRNATTGQYEVSKLAVSNTATTTVNGEDFKNGALEAINTELTKLIPTINEGYVVFAYNGGVMYYDARFQHFAGGLRSSDDLAPWNAGEYGSTEPAGGSTANAYPANGPKTAEENYLGRYGMVRNNWYDVVVTAFNGLGYPEIPSVTVKNPGYDEPDTPDDNLKEHVAVKIHVLSWAKRTQGWSF